MGLFDKRDTKKRGGKDDFDSPVEQIDLASVAAATAAPAAPRAAEPARGAEPARTADGWPAEPARAAEAAREAAREARPTPARGTPEHEDYGIDKAIELMRTLPSENIELVVQVVKFSLESVGIRLPTIIEDAIRRQKDIQGRIGVLRGEIAELEQEIKVRKDEIERLDADHKETTTVRERLELAENLGKAPRSGAVAAPAAAAETRPEALGGLPRLSKQTNPPPTASAGGASPGAPLKK
jgi:uncharacterized small protein (DUF1192 family)